MRTTASHLIRRLLAGCLIAAVIAAGCSSSTSTDTGSGVRLVSAEDGAKIKTSPPEDLVILDVRTPEEFAEGHLEGAVLVDFYNEDFSDQLAELDPNVPYLVYCRSGNRSGQATSMMQDLDFVDVADVDGGIVAWTQAGLDVVGG